MSSEYHITLDGNFLHFLLPSHFSLCSVEYRIDGFLDTSRDKLGDDLVTLIDACCSGYFATTATTTGSKSLTRTSTVKSQTLGKKFKIQLESLLGMLSTTQPHYIKCIKPNTMKVPNCFQGSTCFSQLQALGVFEAVAIRKRGYPCRVTHEEFCQTYGPLFKSQLIAKNAHQAPARIRAEIISVELNKRNGKDPNSHFLVGKTKIFSKFEARDMSKKLLERYHHRCLLKIQSITRGFLTRLLFCDFCYAALDANSFLSKYSIAHQEEEADRGEQAKENEISSLEEVEMLLKRLQRFPYQHYQRLLEVKERILVEIKLFDEIEVMQFVKYREINSQWMSRAQYAKRKKITTGAAMKVYEMYEIVMRGGDDETMAIEESDQEKEEKSSFVEGEQQQPQEKQIDEYREMEVTPLSRLMCGLCWKTFESPPLRRTPRYLSCLHAFCSSCLGDRISQSVSSGSGTTIMCPHPDCRVLSRCPEGLTSFKIAYALVHQLPPICGNCEQRNAVCKCHQCPLESSLLCMICLKAHNKIKAYKKHSVSGLDSTTDTPHGQDEETLFESTSLTKCSIHLERNMDAYCQTCQLLTCLTCAVFHHSNHVIQPFHLAAESERNRLLPCLSDLLNDVSSLQQKQMELSQTIPTLNDQKKGMNDISDRIFSNLSLSLGNRRTEFLSVLDLHYSQKRKALVDFTDSLNYHITSQDSSRKICEEMLEIGNDTEVLSLSQFFQSHLDDMISNSWQQDLTHLETHLSFSCGPEQEVKNLISSVGICKGSTICADPTKSTTEILQIGEFCQQWQVFIRLTLRNSKGQRMLKGGHAVAIEVEEHHEPSHSSTLSSPSHGPLAPSPLITPTSPLGTSQHNPASTNSSVPSGLGKSHTANKKHFSLKPAQASSSSPPSSTNASLSSRNNLQHKSQPYHATTGLTDNQDGTYHLLVTISPSSLKPSETATEDSTSSPKDVLPDAVKISVKIFGLHVEGSPFIFHPLDPQEMVNYNTNHHPASAAPRVGTIPSNSGSQEFTSVTSFLKYIGSRLIQTE